MTMACPVKLLILCILNCLSCFIGFVSSNKTAPYAFVSVVPHEQFPYLVQENEEKPITFGLENQDDFNYELRFVSDDAKIVEIKNETAFIDGGSLMKNVTINIRGIFLGKTFLKMFINHAEFSQKKFDAVHDQNGPDSTLDWYELPKKYELSVGRDESVLSHTFTGLIIILVILANVGMGCKTELSLVKEVLRKPVAPLTGMFSQFILMPLISLMVVYLLKFDPIVGFGFFVMGCSPGGSASNFYSYLLAGDVSLSVTMTFCSTLVSLGMIPLWLFTVGVKVIYDTNVTVPFANIFFSLAGLLIPVVIGMLVKRFRPNWAKYIIKGIRPLMVIFFILVFTLGVYANLYIFTLMSHSPEILLAGALVPYIGFIFGGVVAVITRQSWSRVRTIAIETGIQNTGIAIVLLKMSLPQPDNDISIVAPIAAAIFTPVPMLVAIVGYEVHKRCCGPRKADLYLTDTSCVGESAEALQDDVKIRPRTPPDQAVYLDDVKGDKLPTTDTIIYNNITV